MIADHPSQYTADTAIRAARNLLTAKGYPLRARRDLMAAWHEFDQGSNLTRNLSG